MDRNDVDWAGYFPAVVTPFTESGALEAVTVLLPTSMRPGPDEGCGYAVSSAPRTVRMRQVLDGRFVMRVSYFTDRVTEVKVEAGNYETRFRTVVGPNDVWIVVPEQDEVRGIRFSRDDPASRATVCIAGLVAGIPEAT